MMPLRQLQRRLSHASALETRGNMFRRLRFERFQECLAVKRYVSSSSTSDSKSMDGKDDKAARNSHNQDVFERTFYVHTLSQIVLEYLQDHHHDWLVSQQLDSSLKLHRDGSFELKFPMPEHSEGDVHRIWTSFDEVEKKHWLTIFRGSKVKERFLLQDNLLPAWNNNRKSLPERIHSSVDEMIRLVDCQKG